MKNCFIVLFMSLVGWVSAQSTNDTLQTGLQDASPFALYTNNLSTAYQTNGTVISFARFAGSGLVIVPSAESLESFDFIIDANNGDQGGDSSYKICFNTLSSNYNNNTDFSDTRMSSIEMLVYSTPTKITTTTADTYEIEYEGGQLCINFLQALQSAFDKRHISIKF